jgi:hypothetical protein
MDLRRGSFEINAKEFRPFLLEAIRRHPAPVDFRITRGNIRTACDYARRFLSDAYKNGVGKLTADEFNKIRPRIRVYLNDDGLTFAGLNQKRVECAHWADYQFPFKIVPSSDARWLTLAIEPSADEIRALAALLLKGVLPSPIELRTQLTPEALKQIVPGVHVFKLGRNLVIWPQKEKA